MRKLTMHDFFFQAEDGIRDVAVTGVQTCALPISSSPRRRRAGEAPSRRPRPRARSSSRSEERRVGKECRTRWSLYDKKENLIIEDGMGRKRGKTETEAQRHRGTAETVFTLGKEV